MQIIRWPQLSTTVGLSRTQIWRLEKEGKFPKRIQLSSNSVGWDFEEIQTWLKQKKESSQR